MSRQAKKAKQISAPGKLVVPSPVLSTPSLTPSPSHESNIGSLPPTPPQVCIQDVDADCAPPGLSPSLLPYDKVEDKLSPGHPHDHDIFRPHSAGPPSSSASSSSEDRPSFSRRASYDLFECIEQSKYKRLSESVAKYVFAQVVEAVYYLNEQGITHCDIKDENLVVDRDYKVRSACLLPLRYSDVSYARR